MNAAYLGITRTFDITFEYLLDLNIANIAAITGKFSSAYIIPSSFKINTTPILLHKKPIYS